MNFAILPRALAATSLCVFFVACGDDPELIRKRDEQSAAIIKLEGELAILKEQIKQAPPDRSAEVARLKAEGTKNEEKIAELEEEVDTLEKKKKAIEQQAASYRRKYVIR